MLLQTVGRWLHFFGYALGFGTLAVSAPGARRRGRGGGRGPRRLVGWGIVLLLLAEPLALFGQTASLDPDAPLAPETISGALDSAFGRVLGLRLGAALGLWMLVGAARDGAAGPRGRSWSWVGCWRSSTGGRPTRRAAASVGWSSRSAPCT